jgi:hypothetical protein
MTLRAGEVIATAGDVGAAAWGAAAGAPIGAVVRRLPGNTLRVVYEPASEQLSITEPLPELRIKLMQGTAIVVHDSVTGDTRHVDVRGRVGLVVGPLIADGPQRMDSPEANQGIQGVVYGGQTQGRVLLQERGIEALRGRMLL